MRNNDPSTNRSGEILTQTVQELNLTVLNSMVDDDQRTHIDRSSNSSRCLDYIVSNIPEKVKEVKIDNSLSATPYRVIMKNGEPSARKFSDHKSVLASFTLQPAEVKKLIQKPKFVKDDWSKAKFALETEKIADKGLEMIVNNYDVKKITNMISRETKKSMYKSHKLIKPNRPAEITEDKAMFWNLTKRVEDEVKNLETMKINNQIFEISKKKKLAERGNPMYATNMKNGLLADTKEAIEETLLHHNEELLGRKKHPPQFQELHQMKKDILGTLLETDIPDFKQLTMEDYIAVLNQIYIKKKPMFQMFIESSPRFKVMIFWLLKLIYEQEEIPESFFLTSLIALFKKGEISDPNNYRFIHIKEWLPRIFEMMLYKKVEVVFDVSTPESQTGGMKGADTTEHLVLMINALNMFILENKGLIFTFADIRKCFDRLFLSDAHYFLIKFGGDRKAIKVLSILLGTNKLSLQGGSGRSFTVEDGCGQGNVSVGRSASASISDVMDKNVATHPAPLIVNDVNIANQGFVDDTATADDNNIGVKFSCKAIQNTFDELSLEAHPSKTVHVIAGSPEWVARTREDLDKNPATIQGFNVKTADSEKYLGLKIVSGDISDIIEANIRMKAGKIHLVASKIRDNVRDPRIERIGATRAAAVMIQSEIIPILCYGTEAWLKISRKQYEAMEQILKGAIARILSLPKTTVYDSMLLEMSNYHVEAWIDCMKLNYFQKKLHIKKSGKLYRMLQEDILKKDERGFIGDVRQLCSKYDLPDITLTPVTQEHVRYKCRERSRKVSLMVTMMKRKIPPMLVLSKIYNDHYSYPLMEARAITAMRTGNLIFKNWAIWKFNLKHGGDLKCMYQPCQELDTLQHVLECQFYKTKFVEMNGPTRDWADYLVKLNQERMEEFGQPLISCEGWSSYN